jgi:hypothetical protein
MIIDCLISVQIGMNIFSRAIYIEYIQVVVVYCTSLAYLTCHWILINLITKLK